MGLLGAAPAKICGQFADPPLGPFGVEAAKNLVLVLEPLFAIRPPCCVIHYPVFAIPVQNVVEAPRLIESELAALVEGEVIPPIIADEDVQAVVGQQANGHGADPELRRDPIDLGL